MFDANAFERGKHQRRIRIALALEVAHVRPHFIESQAADSSERAWPAIHSPQISGAIGIGQCKTNGWAEFCMGVANVASPPS
ncbi:MAG TPA: hypothetical protein VIH40_12440, partial [Xanthobacteraceae bacterium]